jgi:hypothetical protein
VGTLHGDEIFPFFLRFLAMFCNGMKTIDAAFLMWSLVLAQDREWTRRPKQGHAVMWHSVTPASAMTSTGHTKYLYNITERSKKKR